MKLLEKNNWIFFRFTIITLLIGGLFFYKTMNWIILEEMDEKLLHNRERVLEIIAGGKPLPQFPPLIEVELTDAQPRPFAIVDTLLLDPVKHEEEIFRQLSSITTVDDRTYLITVRTRLVESEDVFFAVGLSVLLLSVLIFGVLFWLNRRYTHQLWMPFQRNLTSLRNFSLSQPQSINLVESDVTEFEELRTAILRLTQKVQADYRNLKEFTENASHEIQTPLALIRSKIEDLIERETWSENQMKSLQQIYQATNRLSRLNQNLLLLTKIENRQFEDVASISFPDLVEDELSWLSELIDMRQLHVEKQTTASLTVNMSRTLANIMVKNLLENTIRYSRPGDTIFIEVKPGQLCFANPGEAPIEEPEKLFERFHRRGESEGSLGLGLGIVKKIADIYDFQVDYRFDRGLHRFLISFPDSAQNSTLHLS